jgi:hypothetical protein
MENDLTPVMYGLEGNRDRQYLDISYYGDRLHVETDLRNLKRRFLQLANEMGLHESEKLDSAFERIHFWFGDIGEFYTSFTNQKPLRKQMGAGSVSQTGVETDTLRYSVCVDIARIAKMLHENVARQLVRTPKSIPDEAAITKLSQTIALVFDHEIVHVLQNIRKQSRMPDSQLEKDSLGFERKHEIISEVIKCTKQSSGITSLLGMISTAGLIAYHLSGHTIDPNVPDTLLYSSTMATVISPGIFIILKQIDNIHTNYVAKHSSHEEEAYARSNSPIKQLEGLMYSPFSIDTIN